MYTDAKYLVHSIHTTRISIPMYSVLVVLLPTQIYSSHGNTFFAFAVEELKELQAQDGLCQVIWIRSRCV